MRRSVLPVLVLAVAAACESAPTALTPDQPSFARSECGGQTALLDSRVELDFTGSTAINGDSGGNQVFRDGDPGVAGKIYYYDGGCSRSGDLVFSVDSKSTRRLTYHFPQGNSANVPSGGVSGAVWVNFRALMQLGSDVNADGVDTGGRDARIEEKSPGSDRAKEYPATTALRPDYPTFNGTAAQPLRFKSTGIKGCEELEYASIQLTRTAGEFTNLVGSTTRGQWTHGVVGRWTVQSAPSDVGGSSGHWARCYASAKGTLTLNGSWMNMPFSVAVTERPRL